MGGKEGEVGQAVFDFGGAVQVRRSGFAGFAFIFRPPFPPGRDLEVAWRRVDTLVRLANGGRMVKSFARFFRIPLATRQECRGSLFCLRSFACHA